MVEVVEQGSGKEVVVVADDHVAGVGDGHAAGGGDAIEEVLDGALVDDVGQFAADEQGGCGDLVRRVIDLAQVSVNAADRP